MTSERVEPAGGRVTIGAVNTLLTLTSKELESLNLNKIIRLRLNSRISREFDPRLLNYERVPSVNIHIISNNFRHSSWVCEWSKCNNCQLVILTCSWQVWILKTHINQTLTNIPDCVSQLTLRGYKVTQTNIDTFTQKYCWKVYTAMLHVHKMFTWTCVNILLINENC